MSRVPWDAHTYSMGFQELDAQHQAMHELLSTLATELPASGATSLLPVLESLRAVSVGHFALEERMMSEVGYPGASAHARIHSELIQGLDAMIARGREGRLPASDSVLQYFHSWVMDHFRGEDQRLARFLGAPQV